jgi:hypothetical protein
MERGSDFINSPVPQPTSRRVELGGINLFLKYRLKLSQIFSKNEDC